MLNPPTITSNVQHENVTTLLLDCDYPAADSSDQDQSLFLLWAKYDIHFRVFFLFLVTARMN